MKSDLYFLMTWVTKL